MRIYLVTLVLFLFTSCGAFSDLSQGLADGREMLGELKQDYNSMKDGFDEGLKELQETKAELSAMKEEAFKKADKDGDGELDWKEKLLYWALLGGGGIELARRKIKGLQGNVDLAFRRVDEERAKRKRDVEALRGAQAS